MIESNSRRSFIKKAAIAGLSLEIANSGGGSLLFGKPQTGGTRVGIIGLDVSHSPGFTRLLNAAVPDQSFGGYKIVAAYPKGSNDIESSVSRIPEYTKQVQAMGVEIVSSIQELLGKVDVILLNTNDGRLHLEQAMEVLKGGKPMFINKPLAASLNDAVAIFEAARKFNVEVFSSSSMRFMENAADMSVEKIGKVVGADMYSPATLEKTHADLFWYGMHAVEMLYTVMGSGCREVTRVHTGTTDIVVGTWNDNRLGTIRGTRSGAQSYGGIVFGEKATVPVKTGSGLKPITLQILNFFRTGKSPVSPEETLEIYAFMEAADESKRRGGLPVNIMETLKKAGVK